MAKPIEFLHMEREQKTLNERIDSLNKMMLDHERESRIRSHKMDIKIDAILNNIEKLNQKFTDSEEKASSK